MRKAVYYITSDEWDLRALQAVLMSGIARLFIEIYSIVMHGGFLRFQAQYLRRIRLPRWQEVPESVRTQLIEAAKRGDRLACNAPVSALYGLSIKERAVIAAEQPGASHAN